MFNFKCDKQETFIKKKLLKATQFNSMELKRK